MLGKFIRQIHLAPLAVLSWDHPLMCKCNIEQDATFLPRSRLKYGIFSSWCITRHSIMAGVIKNLGSYRETAAYHPSYRFIRDILMRSSAFVYAHGLYVKLEQMSTSQFHHQVLKLYMGSNLLKQNEWVHIYTKLSSVNRQVSFDERDFPAISF